MGKETSYNGFGGFQDFAELVVQLGTSTKTNDKLDALVNYFSNADDKDKVWTIAIFSGRRPKRPVNTTQLAVWCCEISRLDWWLFEESYHVVGDLAETIALLLPDWPEGRENREKRSLNYYLQKLIEIEKQPEAVRKQFIFDSWYEMNQSERFVFNKFFTGGFRIGVSQKLIVNALAKTVNLPPSVIAHRISGHWDPVTISFHELLGEHNATTDWSKPYPFYLAYALEEDVVKLGDPDEWQAEWKWDGIRGQMIKRNSELFVWSRGEDLVTEKFPEYYPLKDKLPDGVVLDGEIICGIIEETGAVKVLPFHLLQTRIGRKNVTKKQLKEAPVIFIAYDLLEYNGEDWREKPLQERREKLEEIIRPPLTPPPAGGENNAQPSLKQAADDSFESRKGEARSADSSPVGGTGTVGAKLGMGAVAASPVILFSSWDELAKIRETSRVINAEGIMLKRKNSIYQVGRKRGDWWKWKINPLTIDCVMIYAQKGAGRRSNLYTAYTFAVRDGDQLVPFTRAYSGLTDKEIAQVDSFVKRNSLEKFGPVRTVKPELVFEIAFEGIAASNRHKSGVALRFPRINRWRHDKTPQEINTLDDLKKMLQLYGK